MRTLATKESKLGPEQIAAVCDHTFLKPVELYKGLARVGDNPIRLRQYDFFRFLQKTCEGTFKPYGICVRSWDIPHARQYLDKHSSRKLALIAVVGFPDGSWYKSHYKFLEAQYALSEGANEIEMTLNWQLLRQGDHGLVLDEIQKVSRLVHSNRGIFKLILETSLLDLRQIDQACHLAQHAKVDFIKTSTGYGVPGIQVNALKKILEGFKGGIKISGGVNRENVRSFLEVVQEARKGEEMVFSPARFRIGESELLDQLSGLQ